MRKRRIWGSRCHDSPPDEHSQYDRCAKQEEQPSAKNERLGDRLEKWLAHEMTSFLMVMRETPPSPGKNLLSFFNIRAP
jgi:hypothetical protein